MIYCVWLNKITVYCVKENTRNYVKSIYCASIPFWYLNRPALRKPRLFSDLLFGLPALWNFFPVEFRNGQADECKVLNPVSANFSFGIQPRAFARCLVLILDRIKPVKVCHSIWQMLTNRFGGQSSDIV